MHRTWIIWILAAIVVVPFVGAAGDATETLVELDKKWGEAGIKGDTAALRGLLADELIAISPGGLRGKPDLLADAESPPEGATTYEASDYEVRFLDEKTAIMVHRVGDPDPHWSLHVWVKRDGRWQVVANANTPVQE